MEGEMSPWASRRRAIILGAMIILLSAASFGVFWKFWYQAPNCSDGLKNGSETGVDCGGSCTLVCSDSVLKPIVRWDPRMFQVSPGVWSLLVYVENPNVSFDASYLPYSFTVYGEGNRILAKREAATILPKAETVGIFEGPLSLGTSTPKRVVFEIGSNLVWEENKEKGDKISVSHSPVTRLDSAPKVEASVKNNTIDSVKNIELVVAVFDGSDNAIAASRTFIDELKKDQTSNVVFTWPRPFKLGSKACEKSSDVALMLDRSGSMGSLASKISTSTPLSEAKEAAVSFVNRLSAADQVSLIGFASKASEPIDLALTSDFDAAKSAIVKVSIESGSTQYTNTYEALHSAWQELISGRAKEKSSKIAILLTDGVANHPKNPQGGTEAADIKYAESMALKEAQEIKSSGIELYSIGLGNSLNEEFLKGLASSPDHYFHAPSAENLESIYRSISSDICQEVPARVEITYKIFGDSM